MARFYQQWFITIGAPALADVASKILGRGFSI